MTSTRDEVVPLGMLMTTPERDCLYVSLYSKDEPQPDGQVLRAGYDR